MRGGRSWFMVLALAGTGFVALTLPQLPARMAIHFNGHGTADNWAGRGAYLWILAVMGLLLPAAIVALVARLGRTAPESLNLPGREFWLQPERRAEGIRRATEGMWWLACLMLALTIAVHGLMLIAHRSAPPHLPHRAFFGVLAGFLLGLIGWMVSLRAAMRPPVGPP